MQDISAMLGGADEGDVRDILKIELTADPHEIRDVIEDKRREMKTAARDLDFETAAILRDEIRLLEEELAKKELPPKNRRGVVKRATAKEVDPEDSV
ncbi:UvrB/UvrC motif-containing protein [Candidatus Uhrbacteria bacterium]|nr:UvrB/UvrC motif-containing protein [Candidatus Uhrbacteria bacterium]